MSSFTIKSNMLPHYALTDTSQHHSDVVGIPGRELKVSTPPPPPEIPRGKLQKGGGGYALKTTIKNSSGYNLIASQKTPSLSLFSRFSVSHVTLTLSEGQIDCYRNKVTGTDRHHAKFRGHSV